jgi:hypothetical protein
MQKWVSLNVSPENAMITKGSSLRCGFMIESIFQYVNSRSQCHASIDAGVGRVSAA